MEVNYDLKVLSSQMIFILYQNFDHELNTLSGENSAKPYLIATEKFRFFKLDH